MPAYDRFHNAARNALIKDGWTITDDPLTLRIGERKLYVDLGAEQIIGAVKEARKIAVEVKTFASLSEITDLHEALGQFVLYHEVLAEQQPDRELYLAVPESTAQGIFQENMGALLLRRRVVKLLSFDPELEEVRQWIP